MTTEPEIICRDRGFTLVHVDNRYEVREKDGKDSYVRFLDAYLAYLDAIGWKDPGAS